MSEQVTIKKAECCMYCENTGSYFGVRDSVFCLKTNRHQFNTSVCELFEKER